MSSGFNLAYSANVSNPQSDVLSGTHQAVSRLPTSSGRRDVHAGRSLLPSSPGTSTSSSSHWFWAPATSFPSPRTRACPFCKFQVRIMLAQAVKVFVGSGQPPVIVDLQHPCCSHSFDLFFVFPLFSLQPPCLPNSHTTSPAARQTRFPSKNGRVGLAVGTSDWSTWVECLQTAARRQHAVAEQLVRALTNRGPGLHLESAVESRWVARTCMERFRPSWCGGLPFLLGVRVGPAFLGFGFSPFLLGVRAGFRFSHAGGWPFLLGVWWLALPS